jgi:hypothetical protein
MKLGVLASSLLLLISLASARWLGTEASIPKLAPGASSRSVFPNSSRTGIDSGPTHHGSDVTTDQTWSPSGNPHIIDNTIDVDSNATLTILPGCIIKFAGGTELQCGYSSPGAIIAVGKPDSTILFTSNAVTPAEGDWQDVGIYDYAMPTTQFMYCTFEYGGAIEWGYGEIYVQEDTVAKIDHCKIWKSGNYGVVAWGPASFTNDSITHCALYPVLISPQFVGSIGGGNMLAGNGTDGVLVGLELEVTTSTTWPNLDVPYVLCAQIEVDGPTCPVLTIAPGTTIELEGDCDLYCGLDNPGAIVADGSSGQIVFTGAQTPPSPGDWGLIGFYDYAGAQSRLTHCKLEYGGNWSTGDVYIRNTTNPLIAYDSIGWSQDWGIDLDGFVYPDTVALRISNTFYSNNSGDIYRPGSGIVGRSPDKAVGKENLATFCGRTILIPAGSGADRMSRELLDASGRKVLDLHLGVNDVSRLAPGVYFVRGPETGDGRPEATQKVVLVQ